jgi:MFS family permease
VSRKDFGAVSSFGLIIVASSIMTAMLELGAFLGAIFVGFVADKYSRKVSIGVGLAWFAVGSTIQTSSFSLAQLIVGRTLGGIGIG